MSGERRSSYQANDGCRSVERLFEGGLGMVEGGVKKGAKPRVGETTVVESPTRAWSCRGLEVLGGFGGVDVIVALRARNPGSLTLRNP